MRFCLCQDGEFQYFLPGHFLHFQLAHILTLHDILMAMFSFNNDYSHTASGIIVSTIQYVHYLSIDIIRTLIGFNNKISNLSEIH